MAGIGEVAKAAGVSPAVVSRVVNGDTTLRIAPSTRERVLHAVSELQYVPLHAARALRLNIPSTVTVVIPDTTSAIYSDLLHGIETAAMERDLVMVLASADAAVKRPDWIRRLAGEGRSDGIIIQPPVAMTRRDVESLATLRVPTVAILSGDASWPVPTAVLDDEAAAAAAVEHLVAFGHRRIGLIGGVRDFPSADRRRRGFDEAVQRRGLPREPAWMTDFGYLSEDGRLAARRIWSTANRPTAVVVANVNAALGVLAELHELGAQLPQDLSVVAIHDVWYADTVWPPLNTVQTPMAALGSAAVGMLFNGIQESPSHIRVVDPPPKVIVRASVARLDETAAVPEEAGMRHLG